MLKSKCIRKGLLAVSMFCGLTAATTLMAAEPGALNYPAGSPGIFIGQFPPIPGVFGISQLSYTSSNALYDSSGDELKDDDFNLDVWVETLRFLASYPGQLFGAHLYSQLVVPIVLDIDSSLSVSTPFGPHEVFNDDDAGLGNITVSPLIMSWKLPESPQYFTLGLDIALEGGASYDEDSSVNAGTGYTTIMPTVAYRYAAPDGLDLGLKLALMYNLENDATNYKTGDMIALDFMAGWNFGKWKVGIVGGYTDQFNADEENGVEVDDHELRSLVMGPSLAYSIGPMQININYQKGLLAENTAMSDSFWLNFTFPLYVPNPPPMPKE